MNTEQPATPTAPKWDFFNRRAWLKILACLVVYLAVFMADEYAMNKGLVMAWKGVAFLLIFTVSVMAIFMGTTFLRRK